MGVLIAPELAVMGYWAFFFSEFLIAHLYYLPPPPQNENYLYAPEGTLTQGIQFSNSTYIPALT